MNRSPRIIQVYRSTAGYLLYDRVRAKYPSRRLVALKQGDALRLQVAEFELSIPSCSSFTVHLTSFYAKLSGVGYALLHPTRPRTKRGHRDATRSHVSPLAAMGAVTPASLGAGLFVSLLAVVSRTTFALIAAKVTWVPRERSSS